jgi:small-conductance mechanosensitive channel
LFTVFISFVTLAVAFVDNLNSFFAGLGIISTALVFTLQDFVASFFGWLHLRVNHLYGMSDGITVNSNGTKYNGKVLKIGIFRTYLQLRLADDSKDSEMFVGRIMSFPNHLVLKGAVDNSTRNNPIIWHTVSWTITFESDYTIAKEVLKQVCERQFDYMIENTHKFLDTNPNRKNLYKPKQYSHVADDGITLTIWFACNIGSYRETLQLFTDDILLSFRHNNIEFAYKTIRYLSPKEEKPLPFSTLD